MNLHIEYRGRGRPLVFFHGWGFDHRIWSLLANVLKKKYALYLVDLPGFGLSSSMSWEHFKSCLLQQLPPQFTVLGWSMGGLFATKLALAAADRVVHLVNIASSPRFIKTDNWPGIDKTVFAHFFNHLTIDPENTIKEFLSLQLRGQSYLLPYAFSPPPETLKEGLTILSRWDFRQDLFKLRLPASYFFGRLDAITPAAILPVMQKIYPQFNYVLFPKAAHMPFLSHQEEFINHLEQVLI
jgi:pimeloyl-[acyl-carrier protein] methyl ester esterase